MCIFVFLNNKFEMKFKTILSIVLFTLLAMACKKEEKETTSEYMTGSISVNIPTFVLPGHAIKASDISQNLYAGGKAIGFYVIDPYTQERDSAAAFEYSKFLPLVVRDTIGTFKFTCGGFAEGYYNSVGSATFDVLDPKPDGSLKNLGIDWNDTTFITDSDGRKYYYTQVNGLMWLRQNIADESAGQPYSYCDATNDVFGRYYTWKEANTICPDGWRLPTVEEWDGLHAADVMVAATLNGERMWPLTPDIKVTNATGLSVLPCGYAEVSTDGYLFKGFKSYATFWTSSEFDGKHIYQCLYEDQNVISSLPADDETFAASVRCVKK